MRRTLLVSLLAMLAAALTLVPAMASAATVTMVDQSGTPLKVGSQINGKASNFYYTFHGNKYYCATIKFSAKVTKNQSTSVTAEGLAGQPGQECKMIYSGGYMSFEMTNFAVAGTMEFFANNTGSIPIEFDTYLPYYGPYECHAEGTLPFGWSNPGSIGFSSSLEEAECSGQPTEMTATGNFTLKGKGDLPVSITVKP